MAKSGNYKHYPTPLGHLGWIWLFLTQGFHSSAESDACFLIKIDPSVGGLVFFKCSSFALILTPSSQLLFRIFLEVEKIQKGNTSVVVYKAITLDLQGPEEKPANVLPDSAIEAHVAFHHPSVGRERECVQTGQSAFICAVFPFGVMRTAKVSQVLVI